MSTAEDTPQRRRKTCDELMSQNLWSVQDVVDYFGLASREVVHKWSKTTWRVPEGQDHKRLNVPQTYRLGREVRYLRDEVLSWFEGQAKR
jgi:hypothetical protein